MFRGLFLKKFQTVFRTILKLLPENTCTRLSCVKFLGRYIHYFSFYERFSKFLDKNIAKISKICMVNLFKAPLAFEVCLEIDNSLLSKGNVVDFGILPKV